MVNKERQLRVFGFVEKLRTLEGNLKGIQSAIVDELRWYGLDYVTCAELPSPGKSDEDLILHNTRPMGFVRHYIEEDYARHDPIHAELQFTTRPYTWADVVRRRKLSKRQKGILDVASSFGFNNGIMVPFVSDTGLITTFTPCGWNPDLSPESMSSLEVIGTFAIHSLQRCRRQRIRELADCEPLTAREREILRLVAIGKADHEIGSILSIAESTVNTHMQNVKRKLGVARRTNAIFKALQLGEISL